MTIRTNGQIIAGSDINSQNLTTCHVVVETYVNGTSWYRVYDDGWVEQGGEYIGVNGSDQSVLLLKEMANNKYYISAECITKNNGTVYSQEYAHTPTTTGFTQNGNSNRVFRWEVKGQGA